MIIEILGGILRYTSDNQDWIANIDAQEKSVLIAFQSNFGALELASGANWDNLAIFIGQVKADAISKGVNWSGN